MRGRDPVRRTPSTPALAQSHAAPAAAPLIGVVAPRANQVVAARVDGHVVRVIAKSGQRVHAGDPIAELDPTLLADRLRSTTATVDAARADAVGADAEVAEARRQVALEARMFAAGATAAESVRITRARLARAVASSDRAEAALHEADARRAAIEAQLSDTRLAAPIDGVVSLVKAQVGEVVAPGAAIARVFDPANLMIRFARRRARRCRKIELSDGDAIDVNPTFLRSHLVVEVAEEAEAEQAIDADSLGKIVNVYGEVGKTEAQRREAGHAQHVAWLLADRRAHRGDGFSLAGAVSEIIHDFRDDVRLGRGGIERERERPVSTGAIQTRLDDDQVARWIEAADLHDAKKPRRGARIRPVKK